MRSSDRLVARIVRRSGPWLGVLAVTAVTGALAQLALPFVLGRTVDALVSAAPSRGTWLGACAAIVVAAVACDALGVWATGACSTRASEWLRHLTVRHVLGAGPALSRRFSEGELATRAGVNAEEAGRAPETLVTGAALVIPTAGGLVALTLIDPWLTLTLAAGLVVIVLVLRAFLRVSTTLAGDYQEAQGDIAARLIDALAGARTIAAAGTHAEEKARVLAPLPRLRAHAMEMWRTNARAGVQAGVVVPLLEVAVLGVGGFRLAAGDLTAGELYSAARYVVLGAGLGSALGYVGRLARARAAAGRIGELLSEPRRAYGRRSLPPGPGTLELRGVTADGLSGVDLLVPGGCSVAVVGRSGAGKSVLAALAGRLADPSGGAVLLDGVELPDLSREALGEAVGYAFERPVLIGETVADAIGLGLREPGPGADPGAPDAPPTPERLEALRAAARAACADAFVRRLPSGYGTPLADAPMSGGERQRLGLARAFAHGRRLLVLDDATSSLDTLTERRVSETLAGELAGRTRLIVTHRVATAAAADRVIWLEGGRVRGYDRHRVLWDDPGYRAVFEVRRTGPDDPGPRPRRTDAAERAGAS
ncbi:ABC transporter ATP-binding protein [Planomonospora parontospora subsp. parontospora]|uniref:ABC transporter ATP-binding protein n=2 Tax=Planomonospora parontospora TaxID=58119 RepID=A0AA37BJ09_9ACTN|nr:ABC transporter ATP-binding protein [Planomonospora parontospora]GGK78692.1 ABC transporter ATP-binding protein [Planomonospora parontospora]GII10294.1 ABC transporter ATP-binding protein [Planomonospora parontospora subsp. parontospora]